MSASWPSTLPLSANFAYPAEYTPADIRTSKRKRSRLGRTQDVIDIDSEHVAEQEQDHFSTGDGLAVQPTTDEFISTPASLAAIRRRQVKASFPHRTSDQHAESLTPKQMRRELATLKPPMHLPLQHGPDRRGPSMKQRSVAVLVGIMYRCILDADWVRAGRAWGMLIHTRFGGRFLDIRKDGLYGVGAEILLRQMHPPDVDDQSSGRPAPTISSAYSQSGFGVARSYYESLAARFTYNKPRSSHPDSLEFGLVMFGLWISALQDYQDQERDGYGRDNPDGKSNSHEQDKYWSSDEDLELEGEEGPSDPWRQKQGCLEQVIAGGELVDERMGEILKPPLTSDHQPLTDLHDQLKIWIEDLKKHRRGATR